MEPELTPDVVARMMVVTMTEELKREIALVLSEYADETNVQSLHEIVQRVTELVESCSQAIDEVMCDLS